MTTEYQAAMAKLAENTKRACATSADVVKAAAKNTSANITKEPVTKGLSFHAKAAFLAHPVYFSVAGGVIIGLVTYHLVNKFWLSKETTVEQNSPA